MTAHYELDGSFSDISGRYQHGRMLTGDPTFEVGQIGRAVTFDGDTEVSFGNVARFDRADAFSLAVWMRGRGNLPIAVFQKLDKLDGAGVAAGSSGGSTTWSSTTSSAGPRA